MSDPIKNREQGSVKPSQASRITDSAQATDVNQNIRLKKDKDQSRQESAQVTSKTNSSAEFVNEANKPLTRARARILALQNSQTIENDSLTTLLYRE